MQDSNISIANALDILPSCNKLSIHGKQNFKHKMIEILKIKIEIHQHGLIYPTLWHAHSVTLVTAILTTCVNLYYKNRGSFSKLLMFFTFSLWPQEPVSLYILFGTILVKVQAMSKGVTFLSVVSAHMKGPTVTYITLHIWCISLSEAPQVRYQWLNRLFRLTSKKHQSSALRALARARKASACHDVAACIC